jgi:hypothetical protein
MKLLLHGEGTRTIHPVEVEENIHLEEIILMYKDRFYPGVAVEEIFLFVEDDEDPLPPHHRHGKHHHHKIHGHRCRKIEVTIQFNGFDKSLVSSPAATGDKLKEKAGKLFDIAPIDLAALKLTESNGLDFNAREHIGSIVSHGDCRALLLLVPDPQIKG